MKLRAYQRYKFNNFRLLFILKYIRSGDTLANSGEEVFRVARYDLVQPLFSTCGNVGGNKCA